jgi:hypothetical protein
LVDIQVFVIEPRFGWHIGAHPFVIVGPFVVVSVFMLLLNLLFFKGELGQFWLGEVGAIG